ncbi:MAG: phosphotransferase [Candidatus Thorarchaeota archaeon]|nr:phosphotransferase [Candidatus Thorarchaeota archaeon]
MSTQEVSGSDARGSVPTHEKAFELRTDTARLTDLPDSEDHSMMEYDADLHLHSPYSIGVSSSMNLDGIVKAAKMKGLSILGTGDATQKDWLRHLRSKLVSVDGALAYDGVHFIVTVEVEDAESIHHIIILPDLECVEVLRRELHSHSPNLDDHWGGRPRVSLSPSELAGTVRDIGGLLGPAHAFTPFKSLFREGKYDSLSSCYGDEASHIHFLELGLSADTVIADHIPELSRVTFITSSDAHSPSPDKLGREFVRLLVEGPTFHEVAMALRREKGRRAVLNVGLDPKLGKYYLSFCSSCRRTLVFDESISTPSHDELNVYVPIVSKEEMPELLMAVHRRQMKCPACGKRMRLGVRDRAIMLGTGQSRSPEHRPPYLHMPPLLEMMMTATDSTKTSKKLLREYETLVSKYGTETKILTGRYDSQLGEYSPRLAQLVRACRDGEVKLIPGGGGRYGKMVPPWGGDEN